MFLGQKSIILHKIECSVAQSCNSPNTYVLDCIFVIFCKLYCNFFLLSNSIVPVLEIPQRDIMVSGNMKNQCFRVDFAFTTPNSWI